MSAGGALGAAGSSVCVGGPLASLDWALEAALEGVEALQGV